VGVQRLRRSWCRSTSATSNSARPYDPSGNRASGIATGEPFMKSSLPDIGDVATRQIGGLEIRLARGGRSDGIPILLTSPWPESIYAHRAIWPEIEALGPLIAVDLPGFGRSEGRADLMSPEAMGDFVIKLAQHFGIGRMHAVG